MIKCQIISRSEIIFFLSLKQITQANKKNQTHIQPKNHWLQYILGDE